jgi:CRISPR-associated protein Cmr4
MSIKTTASGLLGIHALTALHPGAGTALGTVDLPVQRERHTGWPNIAGSALKGILRDACREQVKHNHQDEFEAGKLTKSRRDKANADDAVTHLFGPPTSDSSEFAGAVSITDARLLAYPVRSLKGVFAWVTCPSVLSRAARDANLAGVKSGVPAVPSEIADGQALTAKDCPCLLEGSKLLLEEFSFTRTATVDSQDWAKWIATNILPATDHYKNTRDRFEKTLVILSDNDFTHFVKYATEVTARIGLNYETKTVKDGALFYQEFLPTETLFYSVVIVNAARTRRDKETDKQDDGETLLARLKPMVDKVPVLQIGGDETTGKGFCSVRLNTEVKS